MTLKPTFLMIKSLLHKTTITQNKINEEEAMTEVIEMIAIVTKLTLERRGIIAAIVKEIEIPAERKSAGIVIEMAIGTVIATATGIETEAAREAVTMITGAAVGTGRGIGRMIATGTAPLVTGSAPKEANAIRGTDTVTRLIEAKVAPSERIIAGHRLCHHLVGSTIGSETRSLIATGFLTEGLMLGQGANQSEMDLGKEMNAIGHRHMMVEMDLHFVHEMHRTSDGEMIATEMATITATATGDARELYFKYAPLNIN
mmetsp:Transcript_11797/g.25002  ORF Transcript_11797/g.25002 Transcript_11797/m.25002 type:complete len:258 (-) Transcript_11797:398-1171(-)